MSQGRLVKRILLGATAPALEMEKKCLTGLILIHKIDNS